MSLSIKQALFFGQTTFQQKNIPSASLDAELLLSFVLNKSREYILAHPEINLTKKQIAKYHDLIKQRAKHVPLAYLMKEKEFYGRLFYVDKRVLVPRPETELLVDETKRVLRNPIPRYRGIGFQDERTVIVDVGTGSGCIIVTLAKELKSQKTINFFASDISKDALAVARKNARLHGVADKIKFLHGNLLEPILKNKKFVFHNSSFVICANLPYLTPTQIKNSPTIKREPKLALCAGKDGLKYYRELAKQLQGFRNLLKVSETSNIPISLFAEIGAAQGTAIKNIFSFAESTAVKKDLAGLDRIFIAEL
ncbi:protein-(glutamine-N5) methyltransferase, release factor-specific [Candidatus Falkowbacteria bacterium RIFOXYC2_FULL_47_12]|uniref:Protein-(Glutamine-N5) methyltransferase, release factor-specific n=2 Tax=Candidatus Falkowiibacteriota TaxID=1752728 RepID=A0A1F5TR06_9BACT|nr:MAG: protein-(glutamine-N5) methyltransferase, release factor-specific [Candidatus Falkowbacteria bacterium RIFOXYA2_FULL_47_9]OGF40961.1 MAG: protein-(glutamine-N5) methyltransferase, release factor-specific [Candidatus Falkowbacteria bacterium RIFOXYC2_FULL_47_12]